MTELTGVLDDIVSGAGMRFACIVSGDGFLIENSTAIEESDEVASATVTSILRAVQEAGDALAFGSTAQIMIQYQDGWLLVTRLTEECLLVAAVNNESNLGWVRHAIRKHTKQITDAL
ncbi:MAG: roadblock/LC7 domain-containing protein [Verrucomicrobia bacterium]|nr:roadblock/LC7 domain-containing protein [Verrucomicrobiota bacterium]